MSGRPNLILRAMTSDDLAAVHALELASFRTPWTLAAFRSELENPLSWARVATHRDGTVVGFMIARFYGDVWHLMDLAVRPEDRRRGVAGRLVDEFLEVATGTGAAITLEVRPSNQAALALYRSRAFREVGRRGAYYPDDGEEAVIMTREPVPHPPESGERG